MKPRKGFALLFVALAIGAVIVLFAFLRPASLSVKTSDGSVLTVQKIGFGKRETLTPETAFDHLKQKLLDNLPRSWTKRFVKPAVKGGSSWGSRSMGYTNEPEGLQIYFHRRDTLTGKFQNVDVAAGEIVDDHGCVLSATSMGGQDTGLPPRPSTSTWIASGPSSWSSLSWLSFTDFPREQKRFRLRVYDSQAVLLGEFSIPNPVWPPAPRTNWPVETLPITRREGDVTYTLVSVSFKTNWLKRNALSSPYKGPVGIEPVFEVRINGEPATDWEMDDLTLSDSSSNVSPRVLPLSLFLCPVGATWKLTARFSGPILPSPDSNTVWTLTNLTVPAPGQFVALDSQRVFDGVPVTAVALAGPGEVVYSNGIPFSASVPEGGVRGSFLSGSGRNGVTLQTVNDNVTHLAVNIGATVNNQWLTVYATDEQGRRYPGRVVQSFGGGGRGTGVRAGGSFRLPLAARGVPRGLNYVNLDLPPDVKTISLTMILEAPHTEEFVFQPPSK